MDTTKSSACLCLKHVRHACDTVACMYIKCSLDKKEFLFYFIFGHQTWSLSNSLALFLSLTHSQTLSIFSFALSICSISWPIYYESVRLMLLEAHQLVSFSLSWPDTAVSFFTLNVKIPQWFSLSLSVKHSWSSVLFSVSQTGAAQSLSASLSPFLGKKKIFKCLFILNLFIYFFGGGGGRQKQF